MRTWRVWARVSPFPVIGVVTPTPLETEMQTRELTHALMLAAFCAASAVPAGADTFVTFMPPNVNKRNWSESAYWALPENCGLYPTKGKPNWCNCGPEDNWYATVSTSFGATLDVDAELAGLQHGMGSIDMAGHTLTVFGAMTIGDGDPLTATPMYTNSAAGTAASTLISSGSATFLDDHTYFYVEKVANWRPPWSCPGSTCTSWRRSRTSGP